MQEGYIEFNGYKIWHSVFGKSQGGVPLLVIHGGPGFLSLPQTVSDLADQRPVYFYDQLGCGRSDKAKNTDSYSIEYYINELATVRRQLKLEQVYLMGFSWGCLLIAAYLLKEKPEGIIGLILCGPLLSSPRWEADQRENIEKLPENVRKAIETGENTANYGRQYQDAMMVYYHRHVCRLDPWPEFLNNALDSLSLGVYMKMWGPSEFTVTGTLKKVDLLPELNRIKVPVLLTCGDNDEANPKTVKDYQAAFVEAQMAVIPNASHLHHIEQPEIFKTIVRKFLDQTQHLV